MPTDQRIYNDPANGQQSSVGNQMNTFKYDKMALVEARRKQYFMQLSSVTNMPKHFGKTIKKYHYIPLLDDQNINDQGIDAAGATIANTEYAVHVPHATNNPPKYVEADETNTVKAYSSGDYVYDSGGDQWFLLIADRAAGSNLATADTALTNAQIKALIEADTSGVTATVDANGIDVDGQDLVFSSQADANKVVGIIRGTQAVQRSGNLYGSSKDVGTISGKMPALSETGGRVNRVGFKRKEIEGSIVKRGFFSEYTKESIDFDSDEELEMHIRREMVNGATEMSEDALQIDLLNAAGVVKYGGTATMDSEMDATSLVSYGGLLRMAIDLDNNRCPKQTKVITGTRMVDTKTVSGGRVLYCGSELQPTLEAMVDLHNERAWIPVQKYAAGGTVLNGEEGSVGKFRVIIVPEMMRWHGMGADASGTSTHYETGDSYDIFPMLCVGDESFTTIGFQTDGKTVKFKIKHAKPESPESYAQDPYGETGFMSIKWYYGNLIERPERIALFKTTAKL